jgi:hypothetical protein
MADRDLVRETLRAQNARFTHPKVVASFKGWNRLMRYDFPDIGLSMSITVQDGVPGDPVEDGDGSAQVVYEMSSDTFLAIARHELTGMQAYARRVVKVKASMPDLLKLQKLDAL